MHARRSILLTCFWLLFLITRPATADTALPDKLALSEWEVPWGGRPRDPYVAPNGQVWF